MVVMPARGVGLEESSEGKGPTGGTRCVDRCPVAVRVVGFFASITFVRLLASVLRRVGVTQHHQR
jgi:hypothetical protein